MSNVRKILIVDDDTELREALVEQLALHEEFEAEAVDAGAKGVQSARNGHIDLVIMDVMLKWTSARRDLPPQPAEPPSALAPPERASEGSVAGSRPATSPAQVTLPVPPSAADDYDDLAQRLEEQAAALRAMARQLRGGSK